MYQFPNMMYKHNVHPILVYKVNMIILPNNILFLSIILYYTFHTLLWYS